MLPELSAGSYFAGVVRYDLVAVGALCPASQFVEINGGGWDQRSEPLHSVKVKRPLAG